LEGQQRTGSGIMLRLVAALCLSAGVTMAQPGTPSSLNRATRAELAAKAVQLETATTTGSLKSDQKVKAMEQLAEIRLRLSDGDFRVGDRFSSTITMDSSHSDTISVRDGLLVSVANLPDFPLRGVLRSELDEKLREHLLRYYKNVRIRTIPLTQVSIIGAVARPGFYWTSPDRPITELIMIAGGPLPNANLRELEVRRTNRVFLKPKESRKALEQGRTIEQADVRSGDEVRIPMKRMLNWASIIQLLFVISSLFFAFFQFVQWYYGRQE